MPRSAAARIAVRIPSRPTVSSFPDRRKAAGCRHADVGRRLPCGRNSHRSLRRAARGEDRGRALQAFEPALDRRGDPRGRPDRPLRHRPRRAGRDTRGLRRAGSRLPALLGRTGDEALRARRGRAGGDPCRHARIRAPSCGWSRGRPGPRRAGNYEHLHRSGAGGDEHRYHLGGPDRDRIVGNPTRANDPRRRRRR